MSAFRSLRLRTLEQSDIRSITRRCNEIGAINLGQGLGDLPTPPLVRDAAIDALRRSTNRYSGPEGIIELRRAIARKLERDNGIVADPDREIVVTAGTTGAYAATINGLLDPGDGIVLFEPYYGYHLSAAVLAGLEPQLVRLPPPTFRLTESALRDAIRSNTRAVVLCSPANPMGRMFDRAELASLARVAGEHDLLVITDEIYEYLRYDGREHVSPASLDRLRTRTVTMMGFSKTFSITGWRLGYVVAPDALARAIALVNDLYYVCAPTPLQHAVADGLAMPVTYYERLRVNFQRKRDLMCRALDAMGARTIVPEGAYYVLADIEPLGFRTAADFSAALLREAGIGCVPGTAFCQSDVGNRFARFCFAKDDATLEEACKRLERFARGTR